MSLLGRPTAIAPGSALPTAQFRDTSLAFGLSAIDFRRFGLPSQLPHERLRPTCLSANERGIHPNPGFGCGRFFRRRAQPYRPNESKVMSRGNTTTRRVSTDFDPFAIRPLQFTAETPMNTQHTISRRARNRNNEMRSINAARNHRIMFRNLKFLSRECAAAKIISRFFIPAN